MIKYRIVLHIMCMAMMSLLAGCKTNPYDIDTSEIDLDLSLIRFEQDLFSCESPREIAALAGKYPMFYDLYTNNIQIESPAHVEISEMERAVGYYRFITNRDVDSLYKLASRKFGDFGKYRRELEEAARYIKYYFPENTIDTVYTFLATFKVGSVYIESRDAFAIGLDMYMGRDFEVYGLLDPQYYPKYRTSKFEPQYIVPNAVKNFLYTKVPAPKVESFIDEAIYEGKVLYLMDRLLPNTEDSLKIAYDYGMIEWNETNESNIWSYLIEEDLLFSSDRNNYYKKFLNDGPFTVPFGNESPPKVGVWIGWQIVRAYMEKYPDTTVQDLLKITDHRQLFKDSGYKP